MPTMSDDLIRADLILLHPPSVYDFRDRSDVLFAYLSNSDSVAASPIYEVYPLGFKSIQTYLQRRGFSVRIINLAALMLRQPDLDVPRFLSSLRARLFGIDLHWMCHAHGGLEIARLLKSIHRDTPVVFGGISSTLFWRSLMDYPQVDHVMVGYDTHEPLHRLLLALRDGAPLEQVPNLVRRGPDGTVVRHPEYHAPRRFASDTDADWTAFLDSRRSASPMMMVLPSAGCAYNCGWCGGSRDAMRRIFETRHTVIPKPAETIRAEMASMAKSPAARRANVYALNAYNFGPDALGAYLEGVTRAQIAHVSYEQFHLTRRETLSAMVAASRTTINLSPESHDVEISRLAGRGVYTMDEMETWIQEALDLGVYSIQVWFFIGMPKQTRASVFETVEYCRHLLQRFRKRRVFPLLCPMVPFLDPGCTFFEENEAHGYRVFFRSLEEHRQALVHPSWIRRLNYETRWMDRPEIVDVSYDAVARLTQHKREARALPESVADFVTERLAEAKGLVFEIDETCAKDGVEGVIAKHGAVIRAYNEKMFRGGISDQLYPIPRTLDNRWFDEFEVE
jgi:clorobiocin biosynthesis protein CloN6